MTIAELIQVLSAFPQDVIVKKDHEEGPWELEMADLLRNFDAKKGILTI